MISQFLTTKIIKSTLAERLLSQPFNECHYEYANSNRSLALYALSVVSQTGRHHVMLASIPGSVVIPINSQNLQTVFANVKPTSINVLIHLLTHHTLLRSINSLSLQTGRASSSHTPSSIHRLLEHRILPSEDIVSMLPQPGIISLTQVERLASIRWPVGFVVERRRIPHHFKHYCWDSDRVGRWACSSCAQESCGSTRGVRDVGFVVWRIEVDSIPASVLGK